MKRFVVAALMSLGLLATVGCYPALAQCVNGACSLASTAYIVSGSGGQCGSQSYSYTDRVSGHGCRSRGSRRGCQVSPSCQVQSYQGSSCQAGQCVVQAPATQAPAAASAPTPSPASSFATSSTGSDDALAEVNAARAQRGLRPYVNDPVLNEAARKCAAWRAERLCDGHCALPEGDFTFLKPVYPVGTCAGGCAAWEPSWGWGSCGTFDNYTYCGAAWVMGKDGRRYMHQFLR